MAGHSQFKNIMHRKGRVDAQRSKLFSKLAREITVAAKLGLPDPNMNPRLRAAILAARAENVPKDNIQRAINKAAGNDSENYEEIRYEGYGPGGAALIVEALTDNRNRTASDVRSSFTKSGGNLAETGAVSFMFDRVGLVAFGPRWRMPKPCSKRRSMRAPTTSSRARRGTRSIASRVRWRGDPRTRGEVRRAEGVETHLEGAESSRRRRRIGRKASAVDGNARRP